MAPRARCFLARAAALIAGAGVALGQVEPQRAQAFREQVEVRGAGGRLLRPAV